MIVLNTIPTATNINSRPSQEIIMTATGTSDVIVIKNAQVEETTIGVYPGTSSTAKAQFTIDNVARIADGTAEFHDWALGVVSSGQVDSTSAAITGVRFVCTLGTCRGIVTVKI